LIQQSYTVNKDGTFTERLMTASDRATVDANGRYVVDLGTNRGALEIQRVNNLKVAMGSEGSLNKTAYDAVRTLDGIASVKEFKMPASWDGKIQ
jgi:hypothetical protein